MSLASVTAQQNSAAATAAVATTNQTGSAALNSLSSNFGDFLQLLMTQLQNQDPTSPLDTNQFTSELVQFSQVEQQINTNSSLTQLIQLTQAGEVMQGSSMAGKQVMLSSTQVPLQNGTGIVQFTAPAAEPVAITISSTSGTTIYNGTLNASQGVNTWTWNGTDNSGNSLPDGAYNVAVVGTNTDGSTSPLTFSVVGTATGVQSQSNGIELDVGALTVPFSAIRAVGN
jgi:flagellar basal-body rod modification protein FlgD